MSVTYTKLKSGEWGLRGPGLQSGASVTVTKKSGDTKTETVGRVLWQGDGIALATIAGNGQASGGYSGGGRRDGHRCRNGHAPHPGPCCSGRHRGGDDCGADCCEMD